MEELQAENNYITHLELEIDWLREQNDKLMSMNNSNDRISTKEPENFIEPRTNMNQIGLGGRELPSARRSRLEKKYRLEALEIQKKVKPVEIKKA